MSSNINHREKRQANRRKKKIKNDAGNTEHSAQHLRLVFSEEVDEVNMRIRLAQAVFDVLPHVLDVGFGSSQLACNGLPVEAGSLVQLQFAEFVFLIIGPSWRIGR